MKFSYRPYEVETSAPPYVSNLYRPVIPVHVHGPAGRVTVLGLVDTGADVTLLPAFLIAQLGVNDEPGEEAQVRGVGGQTVTVQYRQVELEVRMMEESHRWGATVGFLEGDAVAILGHSGFLDQFTAAFDSRRRTVTLRTHPHEKGV